MIFKRSIILASVCSLLFSLSFFCVSAEEYEFVEFGTYPGSEVEETTELKNAGYDEKGDTVIGNNRYRKIRENGKDRYFIYEPIVWQKYGNTLVARSIIDCKMYDEQEEKIKDFMGGIKYAYDVTWEECSLRAWLNNEFKNAYFSTDELSRISGEVRLLTVEEAKSKDKNELLKTATDYALCAGVQRHNTEYSEWFLKDISPITGSVVCTVENDGDINTGITVLVNEKGMGLVPCIDLNNFSGLSSHSEKAPEKTYEMYYPGGKTALYPESQINSAIASGWHMDKNEAMKASGLYMKSRFSEWELNGNYDWRLFTPQGKSPYIIIESPTENMTPVQVINYIKPIMDKFYTGYMEDYMEIHAEFVYGKETAASLSEFSDTVGESIHDAVEACWSGWGNIICSDAGAGRLSGTSGAKHTVTLRLKINGDGQYSLTRTNYHNILHALAGNARAYSQRPLGQLQYLRNYFGQNTLYDGSLFTNEPNTLITNGEGVCGSYANFTTDFCKLLGIPCVIYTNDLAAHAWNGVFVEGKWYHMDHTGNKDEEYMRTSYANYNVDGDIFGFDSTGFPKEHTAENVSFLEDSYLPIDNLSGDDLWYVQKLFEGDAGKVTVAPSEAQAESVKSQEITVLLNGEKLIFDVLPVIENGRTLVPMRKIFEALGATVYWNNDTRTATGVRDVTVVTISVDSRNFTKNGENILLDVPARLINSRTLVPVRVIAESFGLNVSWDSENRTVIIEG